jgi:hypothetical protein
VAVHLGLLVERCYDTARFVVDPGLDSFKLLTLTRTLKIDWTIDLNRRHICRRRTVD